MKFSHQLAVNAFAPWSEQYIQYRKLKKMAKRMRRELKGVEDIATNWEPFSKELTLEVTKFAQFFRDMLSKVSAKVDAFAVSLSTGSTARDTKKKKVGTELYLELSELKKFIFLNAEGTRKSVKKFDKLHASSFLEKYMDGCEAVHEMLLEQKEVDAQTDKLIHCFATAFTDGDMGEAHGILSKSLSDLLDWEKGTIWSDLLKLDRSRRLIGSRRKQEGAVMVATEKNAVSTDSGIFRHYPLVIANGLVVFVSVASFCNVIPGLPFHASRCLAVLILVSGWWSLGTFPLYVSALAVPVLVVTCDVLPDVSRQESAQLVLQHMWSGSQAMVLASFALAAALSKLNLDKQLACWIISIVKNGRKKIMLALMLIGWASSFAVGNMAASVLCLSLAAPILDELPQLEPATAEYGRQLLIAIAFACNYGGMTSPVASPQNIVAFAALLPFGLTFTQWVLVAVPTSFVLLLVTFWYLSPSPRGVRKTQSSVYAPRVRNSSLKLPLIEPNRQKQPNSPSESDNETTVLTSPDDELPPRLTEANSVKKFHWTWDRQAVIFLTVFAASLWMASALTTSTFGDVGLASLLPLMLLFALPGVLTKSDFLSMPWDVCLLLASGGVLSLAVSRSSLLSIVGQATSDYLVNLSPVACQIICCVFVTAVSTCVSHTAAANVLMPFIVELAKSEVGKNRAVPFILPISLCLSAGMALPVSSCPNMNATAMARGTDESQPWVGPSDYLKPGLALSVVAVAAFVFIADPLCDYVC